jgi:hypothetical protein
MPRLDDAGGGELGHPIEVLSYLTPNAPIQIASIRINIARSLMGSGEEGSSVTRQIRFA